MAGGALVEVEIVAAVEPAQAFELVLARTVEDGRGDTFMLSSLVAGKPAVINYWATWCPYCIDEMPDYQQLYERYGADIAFVMLDVADGQRETITKGASYISEHGYTFPVYYATTRSALDAFGVTAYPTSVVIDAAEQLREISLW